MTKKVKASPRNPESFGITLSVDPKEITQPSFPVRWKYTDELLERIKAGRAKGYGYAILIIARDDEEYYFHYEQRSLASTLQFFQLLEVPRSGNWTITALVFERTKLPTYGADTGKVLAEDLHENYLKTQKGWRAHDLRIKYDQSVINYDELVVDSPAEQGTSAFYGRPENGILIAKHVVQVSVSPDVFPAPPPAWLSAYVNYFWGGRMPYNPCYFGRRLLLMIPGVLPWLLIELVKRMVLGLIALIMFLTCRRYWWKFGDAALEPSANVQFPYFDESDVLTPIDLYKAPWTRWVTPFSLLCFGGVFYVAEQNLQGSAVQQMGVQALHVAGKTVQSGSVLTVLLLVPLLALAFFYRKRLFSLLDGLWHDMLTPGFERVMDKLDDWDQERRKKGVEQTLVRGKEEAQALTTFAGYLTTDTPVELRVEAVPKPLRPKGFNWLGLFKRSHCSPYGA